MNLPVQFKAATQMIYQIFFSPHSLKAASQRETHPVSWFTTPGYALKLFSKREKMKKE